jgi:hypothetical protein
MENLASLCSEKVDQCRSVPPVAVSVANEEGGSRNLGRSRSYIVFSGGDDRAIHVIDSQVERNVQGTVEVRVTSKGSL